MRWEVGGRTAVVLWGVASRICSGQHITFLCSSYLAFICFVGVHVVHQYSNIDTVRAWIKSYFILLN